MDMNYFLSMREAEAREQAIRKIIELGKYPFPPPFSILCEECGLPPELMTKSEYERIMLAIGGPL